MEINILLNNFEKVRNFVDLAAEKSFDIWLCSKKSAVNAKSISEVFTLDLTDVLTVKTDVEDHKFARELQNFSSYAIN